MLDYRLLDYLLSIDDEDAGYTYAEYQLYFAPKQAARKYGSLKEIKDRVLPNRDIADLDAPYASLPR